MTYELQNQIQAQIQNNSLTTESAIANSSCVSANSSINSAVNPSSASPALHMQKLQDRMNQLEKAIIGLGKKESYVAAMAVDLEHIMMILIKRLNREEDTRAIAAF